MTAPLGWNHSPAAELQVFDAWIGRWFWPGIEEGLLCSSTLPATGSRAPVVLKTHWLKRRRMILGGGWCPPAEAPSSILWFLLPCTCPRLRAFVFSCNLLDAGLHCGDRIAFSSLSDVAWHIFHQIPDTQPSGFGFWEWMTGVPLLNTCLQPGSCAQCPWCNSRKTTHMSLQTVDWIHKSGDLSRPSSWNWLQVPSAGGFEGTMAVTGLNNICFLDGWWDLGLRPRPGKPHRSGEGQSWLKFQLHSYQPCSRGPGLWGLSYSKPLCLPPDKGEGIKSAVAIGCSVDERRQWGHNAWCVVNVQ